MLFKAVLSITSSNKQSWTGING
jgi:DNA-binding CsgD family transcriptional regulator